MLTAKIVYDRLASTRSPWLDRARENAAYTSPAVFPPEHTKGSDDLEHTHQSLGARGLKNLASKLLLILLPPNIPFFKYTIPTFDMDKLRQSDQEGPGLVLEALSKAERAITTHIEMSNLRNALYASLRQLLAAGNVLLTFDRKDNLYRTFRMDSYVVRRKATGKVVDLIIREEIDADLLPEEVRVACEVELEESAEAEPKPIEMFTRYTLVNGRYQVQQEINAHLVPESQGNYPEGSPPFVAARIYPEDGENWGRSYLEEYIGDLMAYNGLNRAIQDGAAAMSKILIMLAPGSPMREKDLEKKSLSIIRGRAQDISVMQTEKYGDYRVALEAAQDCKTRLEFAFLLHSAVQRGGDRVTATEFRTLATELEDSLGGLYTSLTSELQNPLVALNERVLTGQGKLPKMPKEVVPTITTGLQALGRGHDVERMKAFITDVAQLGGPENLRNILGIDELVRRLSAAYGIDATGLVLSREEQNKRMMQQQMMQMAQSAGPDVIKQMMNGEVPAGGVPTPEGAPAQAPPTE